MSSSLAAIHVAKKQLGLDDDTYRAKLSNITGKTSTKDMSEDERQRVLTVFRNEGFAPAGAQRRQNGRQKLSGKFAKKLQALWIAGWNLGIIRDRDDAALVAFVKGRTGLDHVRFLHDAGDARRAIEALKGWMAREAGVDWTDSNDRQFFERADGYRIARAQWRLINPIGRVLFWKVVADVLKRDQDRRDLTTAEWIKVMNHFGERIRAENPKAVKP
jgi:phage gp16-like protein